MSSLIRYGAYTTASTWRFRISRGDQADHGQAGKACQEGSIRRLGLTWEEAEATALSRQEWRRSDASVWTWAEARSRSRCFHSVAMKHHSVALWRFCALGTVYLRSVYYLLTYYTYFLQMCCYIIRWLTVEYVVAHRSRSALAVVAIRRSYRSYSTRVCTTICWRSPTSVTTAPYRHEFTCF